MLVHRLSLTFALPLNFLVMVLSVLASSSTCPPRDNMPGAAAYNTRESKATQWGSGAEAEVRGNLACEWGSL